MMVAARGGRKVIGMGGPDRLWGQILSRAKWEMKPAAPRRLFLFAETMAGFAKQTWPLPT
jgi:hypothetical protein